MIRRLLAFTSKSYLTLLVGTVKRSYGILSSLTLMAITPVLVFKKIT
jgi:hypothetical protein